MRRLIGFVLRSKYGELFRFIIGGIATTAVNWVIYIPVFWLFKASFIEETAAIIANAIAWFGAVVFAFIINRILVFHSEEKRKKQIFMQFFWFTATRSITGVAEIFMPSVLMLAFDMNDMLARLIIAVVLMICNYLTSKFIAFKH